MTAPAGKPSFWRHPLFTAAAVIFLGISAATPFRKPRDAPHLPADAPSRQAVAMPSLSWRGAPCELEPPQEPVQQPSSLEVGAAARGKPRPYRLETSERLRLDRGEATERDFDAPVFGIAKPLIPSMPPGYLAGLASEPSIFRLPPIDEEMP